MISGILLGLIFSRVWNKGMLIIVHGMNLHIITGFSQILDIFVALRTKDEANTTDTGHQ
jgi:hypothetical protein